MQAKLEPVRVEPYRESMTMLGAKPYLQILEQGSNKHPKFKELITTTKKFYSTDVDPIKKICIRNLLMFVIS